MKNKHEFSLECEPVNTLAMLPNSIFCTRCITFRKMSELEAEPNLSSQAEKGFQKKASYGCNGPL
jgi:hypothetical protein